jgi:sortase A
MKLSVLGVGGLLLLTTAAWLNGSYIMLKAELAQYLISDSWARSQTGEALRPWPWADTWPIARIRFKTEDLYVLAGAHGSALAFGPGHVDGTASPGTYGTSVVAGHRDTHFRGLEQLEPGDPIELQDTGKNWLSYVVNSTRIVDTRVEPGFPVSATDTRLILVTCYPFDAIEPGGPLRYVVEADLSAEPREKSKEVEERVDRTPTLYGANG